MRAYPLAITFAAALCATSAQADIVSINLGNYQLNGNFALDTLGGVGLEASAVTYARDRGTLFFVGDEGLGVVEISKTGSTIGSMSFNWTGTGAANQDSEGLTYLGAGVLVLAEERFQVAYKFGYTAGGTVVLNDQPKARLTGSNASVGNVGTEGISVDPRNGSLYSVKQDNPAELRTHSVDFGPGGSGVFGTSTNSVLASGASALFGLNSLSDVQTLAPVDALAGQSAAGNLLILSLDSRRLVELNPSTNTVLSSFDLAPLTTQAIEGVTVDEAGRIYLVAEHSGANPSRLFVLTPVPVPAAVWLFGSAVAGLAGYARGRRATA